MRKIKLQWMQTCGLVLALLIASCGPCIAQGMYVSQRCIWQTLHHTIIIAVVWCLFVTCMAAACSVSHAGPLLAVHWSPGLAFKSMLSFMLSPSSCLVQRYLSYKHDAKQHVVPYSSCTCQQLVLSVSRVSIAALLLQEQFELMASYSSCYSSA